MNENYPMPEMPEGASEGIVQRHVLAARGRQGEGAARAAARLRHDPARGARRGRSAARRLRRRADVWSVPSFTELDARRRCGRSARTACTRSQTPRRATSSSASAPRKGPVVAATDYMRSYADQIRAFVPRRLQRARHRRLRPQRHARQAARATSRSTVTHVAVAALSALADEGTIDRARVREAIAKYKLDPNKVDPLPPERRGPHRDKR